MKNKNSFALGALVGSVVTAIGFGIGLGLNRKKKEFDDLSIRLDDPTDFDFSILEDNLEEDIYIKPALLKKDVEEKADDIKITVGKKLKDTSKKTKDVKKKVEKKSEAVKKKAKKETKKITKDVKKTAKDAKKAVDTVVEEIKE